MEIDRELREVVRHKLEERRNVLRELRAIESLLRRDLPGFVAARKRMRALRKEGKLEDANRAKAEFGPLAGRVCGLLAKAQRLRESLRKVETPGQA